METQETKPQAVPTQSEQINELAAALAKAQGAIKGAVKDSSNPYYSSTYADLASVWEACRAALSANGLAVSQLPSGGQGWARVRTVLMHSSGQWIASDLAVPVIRESKKGESGAPGVELKPNAQSYGSAITYARRFALASMVGVAPEDDDGNTASGISHEASVKAYVGSAAKKPASSNKELTVPFGPHKGEPIPKQSDETLKMLVDAMGKSIADPDKARFKESNQALLDAVNSEILKRKADIPF